MPLTLRRSLYSRGAVVQGDPGGVGALAEPIFAQIPGNLSHAFQDWSGYASPATVNANNAADGSHWDIDDPGSTFDSDHDPYSSATRSLHMNFTAPGDFGATYGKGAVLNESGMLNRGTLNGSSVAEWAVKVVPSSEFADAQVCYWGKTCDYQPHGNEVRHDYDPRQDLLGFQATPPLPSTDIIRSKHYPGGVPVDSGHPPIPNTWTPTDVAGWATLVLPDGISDVWFAKPTMNYGGSAGAPVQGKMFWGYELRTHPTAGPTNVGGVEPRDMATWWKFKMRWTKDPNDDPRRGRIEGWVNKGDGFGTFKFMQYIGDVGGFDENQCWVFKPGVYPVHAGTILYFYHLCATGHVGNCRMRLGYLHFWSHPWLPLT